MKFLIAAWYEFLKNVRDIKMIAIIIVFPIITIYMLGSAVAGFFETDISPKFEIAVVNQDDGIVGSEFDKFLGNKDISEKLTVKAFESQDEAKSAVDAGTYTALVYLPKGMTTALANGDKQQIVIYGKENMEFVETLVSGFASGFNTVNAAVTTGLMPVQIHSETAIQRVNRVKGDAFPNMKDYYAVLILLQILIAGGVFGVYITTKPYGSDMHIRVHALPVNKWSLLSGRILGSTVYMALASAVIIVFTGLAYGINWNGSMPIMAGTILLFCFIMVGAGAVFGKLFSKSTTALMMVMVLLFAFGIVSGAVSPTSGVTAFGFLTPNYYAKVLLFGSIYGYPAQVMVQSALCLAVFAAITYGALAVLTRRRGNDNL